MAFWQDYKWVILFYSAILLLIYIFRKKFDIHHKFLAMYRTKVGLKLMDRWGEKYREQIKLLGYIGIGVGYVGLFTILPTATSAVGVVVPGV